MIAALLLRLAPYKLIAECLAIGALVAYVAFQSHDFCMHQQQIGYDRAKAEQGALDKVRNEAQAKIDAALNKRVSDAEGKADERAKLQQGLNAAVGASADRLQHAIDGVRASSNTATVEALRATTATLATVFQDCSGRYREMAKNADGHASDVQTLSDGWPTNPPAHK